MVKARKRATIGPVVVVIAIAAALLTAAWKAAGSARLALLRHQLQHSSDSDVAPLLRRALKTSGLGWESSLVALESDRPAVVAAAQEVLFEEMARWQLLPVGEAQQRQIELARQLADCIELLPDKGRRAAADIATLLLTSEEGAPATHQRELVLSCERVLRSSLDLLPSQATGVTDAGQITTAVRTASWVSTPNHQEPPNDTLQAIAEVSVGQQAAKAVRQLGESDESEMPHALPVAMPQFAGHPAPQLLPPDMSHARPLGQSRESPGAAAPMPSAPETFHSSQLLAPGTPHSRPAAEHAIESNLETMRLVERLHAEDASLAERARGELTRRGLTPTELEIAQRLSDPDPAVRLRWLNALPGLHEIDARPWLLWLSRDADAEIRRATLSIMATSGEAEMMRRVAEMAREEIDPRVKQQAVDIAERLDRARGR